MIKDDELLEKYNEIWTKVGNNFKKGIDREPAYNEKYLNSKTKYYEGKFFCFLLKLIGSVYRKAKGYYPEVFLEEFKYVVKESKILQNITDIIEAF